MTFSIQSDSGLFSRTISETLVDHIKTTSNREEAIYMSVWDKIKDWFCDGVKEKALNYLYDLLHQNNNLNAENKTNQLIAFHQLSAMAGPAQQDRFQASFENGVFKFSIASDGAGDYLIEKEINFNKVDNDIDVVHQYEFDNSEELFEQGQDPYVAIKNVKLTRNSSGEISVEGVTKKNADRAIPGNLSEAQINKLESSANLQKFLMFKSQALSYGVKLTDKLSAFNDQDNPENYVQSAMSFISKDMMYSLQHTYLDSM